MCLIIWGIPFFAFVLSKVTESTAHKRSKREATDEQAVNRMLKILQRYRDITPLNCKTKKAYELLLPGDAAYGVEKQFEAQGRTALRLAHFLSNFLQNVDEYEVGALRMSFIGLYLVTTQVY